MHCLILEGNWEHDKFHSYVSALTTVDNVDNKCNNFGKLDKGEEKERKGKHIFLRVLQQVLLFKHGCIYIPFKELNLLSNFSACFGVLWVNDTFYSIDLKYIRKEVGCHETS